jgi:hypothetical protein
MYLWTLVNPQHSASEVEGPPIPIAPSAPEALLDRVPRSPSFCETLLLVPLNLQLAVKRS